MSDTCIFMFGRCNPVHNGHGHVFDHALSLQKDLNAELKLFLSATEDDKKNPLPLDLKQYYINGFYPSIGKVLQDEPHANLFNIMSSLDGKYQNIIFVGGSDRKEEFKQKLDKYNGVLYTFDNIWTEQAGIDRSISNFSSTMMREYALKEDYDTFSKALPGTDDVLKYQMFMDVQKRLKR